MKSNHKRTSSTRETAWAGVGLLFFFGMAISVDTIHTYPLWGTLAAVACVAAMVGCAYMGRVYYWQKGGGHGQQRQNYP